MGLNYRRNRTEIKWYTEGARRAVKRGTRRTERRAAEREIQRMLAEDALGDLPDAMDVLHEEALRDNEIFDAARDSFDDEFDCYCCCCTGECRTEV